MKTIEKRSSKYADEYSTRRFLSLCCNAGEHIDRCPVKMIEYISISNNIIMKSEGNKVVIHSIDCELWRKVKARAAMEDKSIAEMMNIIVATYFK